MSFSQENIEKVYLLVYLPNFRGCKKNYVTARFKYEELTAPQTQS